MHVRVEPRRMRSFEFLEERLLVAPMSDIIANVIRVRKCEHDDVVSAPIAERSRAGGLGFFVLGLAMNNGRDRFAGIFPHSFPDAHHVSTCGIDNLAAAVFDLLLDRQFRPKRRHDHDIFRSQIGNVGVLVFAGKIFNT